MKPIRVFFQLNQILIDSIPEPFIEGSLLATLNAGNIEIRRFESAFLFTSIPWAIVGRRDGSTFDTPDEVLAYLAAEFAENRPVGDAFGVATSVDQGLAAGLPVAVSRASGRLVLARSDSYALAFVAGLAPEDIAAGFAVQPARGAVTLDNWSAVTGRTLLAQGQPYFLAPTGGLATTPIGPGAACVARVGLAASPTTLICNPTDPILL